MTTSRKNFLGIIFSLFSVLAFAMEWWFTRELKAFHLTGFFLICLLLFVATLFVSFGIFSQKNRKNFPKKGLKNLFLFGLVDVFAFGFFFLALLDIPVVKTLLWGNMSVFYILILSPFIGDEKITTRKIIAGALGFSGMAIYLLFGNNSENFLDFSRGDFYGFLCGISMTGFHFLGGKNKETPLFWRIFFSWFAGFLLFPILFFFFNTGFSMHSFLSPEFNFLFWGMIMSSLVMATVFYQLAIKLLDVSKVATIRMTEPVFQGITAFFIANETLNLFQGIGVMLLVWGIFLIRK